MDNTITPRKFLEATTGGALLLALVVGIYCLPELLRAAALWRVGGGL